MKNNFHEYARYYDLLYQDKNYYGEAQFVSRLMSSYLEKPTEKTEILDLASGTGRHTQELAKIGYFVEGSDLSLDMVLVARARAETLGMPIHYYNESFQTCNQIGRKYDAVIAMFSAINYLTDYKDFKNTLINIRLLLREGGVFIFDFWNGNAVIDNYSASRVKRAEKGDEAVIRISNTVLDRIAQISTVSFDFILLKAGQIVREFSEVHAIRYFFPQEMLNLLEANGFEVIHRCPFLRESDAIEPDDWNLTYVARPRV